MRLQLYFYHTDVRHTRALSDAILKNSVLLSLPQFAADLSVSVQAELSPAAILVRREGSGRPLIAWQEKDPAAAQLAAAGLNAPEVSLSHSGCWTLCAVSQHRIGADLERWRPAPYQKLAARFFTAGETRLLAHTGDAGCAALFYRLWVRKEAAFKCLLTGASLLPSLKKLDVRGGEIFLAGEHAYLYDLPVCPPGYTAAVCCQRHSAPVITFVPELPPLETP